MWQTLNLSEVKQKVKTNFQYGLTNEEANKRFIQYGENILKDKPKERLFIRFCKQFNDFMIIILIIASIISAIITKFQGENDYIDSIIIIGIVVLNATMGVIQEYKAEKSLEALKKMTTPKTSVKRDGRVRIINSTELVPGDIVLLEAGNFVPADCRLIKSINLKVEESSLTGETIPVEKNANIILKNNVSVGDMLNMVFANTLVVNGHAEAVVTETGMNTKVGKIAKMIINNETPETPIQKKLAEVGKTLGLACVGICALIFFMGLIKKIPPVEMFLTSVGLAVAAIPEGLPAVVTIVLSIGVTSMAKKNSIIRKLPAVETLGSSTVICSDKTGTLTKNKMEVVEVKPFGSFKKNDVLEFGTLCTDAQINFENGKEIEMGDPTEIAIIRACAKNGITKKNLCEKFERLNDIPFDSERKMMTTIHKLENKYRIITKGAPEVILKKCNLSAGNEKIILNQNENMAKNALRVIAVSYKDVEFLPNKIENNFIEKNLNFIGLIGMIDPPREEAKEAIATCRKAGIKPVMITGDHIETANAIAHELNIFQNGDLSISGSELDKIPSDLFEENIMKYSVFARVTPEHKVKIVKAFQKHGEVVAMTGDGVNDAPALKIANIGIAMGQNGTDVAKSAADMVLTDDNFVTIVEAVKQGRTVFNNIKKAIHFLIATNVGEIVTMFFGLLIGMKSPLIAIQLLWINLVTDSFPAIALGLEKSNKNIMDEKPRDPKKSIFADGLWTRIVLEGTMIGLLDLFTFTIGTKLYGIEVGRTMAFMTLGFSELIHCFNIKSNKSIINMEFFNNKYLIFAFILGIFLQAVVVVIPGLANIFELKLLNASQWIFTICISVLPIIIMELQKFIDGFNFSKSFDFISKQKEKC